MLNIQKIVPLFCAVGMLMTMAVTMRTASLSNSCGLTREALIAKAIDEGDLAQIGAGLPGIDIDAEFVSKNTPLMMAVRIGREETVRYLIDHGAHVGATNSFGWTALHTAASVGNSQIVHLLLQNGAQVDAKSRQGVTPLILAAQRGSVMVVRQLLERGADAKWRDQYGETAEIAARQAGHTELAKMLGAEDKSVALQRR